MIIAEFKKFIYLTALEVLTRKRERRLGKERVERTDGKFYFQSPYCAPPYIDRFWRLFILYNPNYEKFMSKLCGGFIDRDDPRENFPAAFERYQATLKALEKKKGLLKPFWNLWPKYKNIDEFMTDYEFTSYVSEEGIPQICQFM